MTITLRPEHEKVVTQAVESGAYQSPDDLASPAAESLAQPAAGIRDLPAASPTG
jgi:hypothetical protein